MGLRCSVSLTKWLMHRQGIGFSVHGVVVDRKTLSRIFFLVMGTVGKQGTRSSLGC